MMEFFKGLTKGIQNRTWVPFGKKESDEAGKGSASGAVAVKAVSFCDPCSRKPCITVCSPKAGCECDCEVIRVAVKEEMRRRGVDFTLGAAKFGCSGKCRKGPFIGFPQKGFFYERVTLQDVTDIVVQTLMQGRILYPLLSLSPDRSYRDDIYYEKDTGLLGVIDESICMVEATKYFLDFEKDLSCGKCVPCRIGMKRMHEAVEGILVGTGSLEDLEQVKSLCKTLIETPHCEFAAASSRPVLSAITHFEDEFRAHAERVECLTGVCEEFLAPQRKLRAERQAEEEARAAEKAKIAEKERIEKAAAEAAAKAELAKAPPVSEEPEKVEAAEKLEEVQVEAAPVAAERVEVVVALGTPGKAEEAAVVAEVSVSPEPIESAEGVEEAAIAAPETATLLEEAEAPREVAEPARAPEPRKDKGGSKKKGGGKASKGKKK